MISVIVPVYNAALTLQRCLDSILSQTYKDIELLLIDDGSVDESGNICDEYAMLYSFVTAIHQTNKGASAARNYGIEHAKGDWVTFCDADDYVDPDWLQNFINNSNGVDVVIERINIIGEKNEIAGPDYTYEGTGLDMMIKLKYAGGTIGYPVNKLFKTKILQESNIRYRCDIKLREDEDFVLRYLSYIEKGRIIPLTGYNYILPDYWHKYAKVDVFDTLIALYATAKDISKGYRNSALDLYQVELTNHFMASVYAGKWSYFGPFIKIVGFDFFRLISFKAMFNKIFHFYRKRSA